MSFIQHQNKIRKDYEVRRNTSIVGEFLQKRSTKGVILLTIIAIAVPILVYYFIFNQGIFPPVPVDTCSISGTYRIPCGSNTSKTFDDCLKINCCFENATKQCFHFLPSRYYYFEDSQQYQSSLEKSPFGVALSKTIQLTVNEINENTVQIVLHEDPKTKTFSTVLDKNYHYNVYKNPLSVEITRKDYAHVLLTTAIGPLIVSERYWEWSFQLTEEYLFGLGQTLIDLDKNSTLTKVIYANSLDHTTLPVFLAYKNDSYHGLIVRHHGPLEVTVYPSKLVSLKSLGGKEIILELSVGPTLKEVIQQQRSNYDFNKYDLDMLLGVHICREGNVTILQDILKDFGDEQNKVPTYNIKYQSDCLHENVGLALQKEKYQKNKALLVNYINQINSKSKFMMAFLPQVAANSELYNATSDLQVLYQNQSIDYYGKFEGIDVAYPNFANTKNDSFVNKTFENLQQIFGNVSIDDAIFGYFLTRNWPQDDSFQFNSTAFQYMSQNIHEAMSFTLPWFLVNQQETHLLEHNHYGDFQLRAIQKAKPDKFHMTASHTVDTITPVLVQNVPLTWSSFRKTLMTYLFNSILGNPFISVPVCGTTGPIDTPYESICLRWYLMAATSPVLRISSDFPRRDPNSLADNISKYLSDKANYSINLRLRLRQYFSTILEKNEPIMRPMFYNYPNDKETFPLVNQYMVGDSLLVLHPTLPALNRIQIYFPEGLWFEFNGGLTYGDKNRSMILDMVETDWIAFIMEESIIPLIQIDDQTQEELLVLKVALKCNTACNGIGRLTIGNVGFQSDDSNLNITVSGNIDEIKNVYLTEVMVFQYGTVRFLKLEEKKLLSDIKSCSYVDTSTCVC